MIPFPTICLSVALALLLGACASGGARHAGSPAMFSHARSSEHRGNDDLLTAGLGLDGLRSTAAPAFADPAAPTRAELRRRALWSNWRGIADLAPDGGYGSLYGSTAAIPGREFHAYATVPGATQPHRVMVQLPDAFDVDRPCVVVTASSGSRGIYGAIAVAGAWGLPKGCAVAYTDKGAGTDYFDLDAQRGIRADGTVGALGEADDLAFVPDAPVNASGVAFKHAHSQDNPEADWGRHVKQAAQFALHVLNQAHPGRHFDFANTRVIATGISNGGGAVLRAAEGDSTWLDAVVAGEPNVTVAGARPLYDVTTEAALLMPCALPALGLPPMPYAAARCASLRDAGLIEGADLAAQQRSALARLRAHGWTEPALRAGAISVGFDLWRAVGSAYAAAYGRFAVDEHPCGYRWAAQASSSAPRAASDVERAAWWADASGIPPGAGIGLVEGAGAGSLAAAAEDPAFASLRCLRALWDGQGATADRVRRGVAELRATAPRAGLPVLVVHGTDDGLVPMAHTSTPYVTAARAAGHRDVRFWQVRNAQHFDAFLGLPVYAAQYVPLLPYVYAALDRAWDHLETGAPLPADAEIAATPRNAGQSLEASNLSLP